jgi:hypothetical protein
MPVKLPSNGALTMAQPGRTLQVQLQKLSDLLRERISCAVGGATFPISYSYERNGTVTASTGDAGIYTVTATVAGDANHNGATATLTADIYTMLGTLYRCLTVTEGTTREILPEGVYVIVINEKCFKVISR